MLCAAGLLAAVVLVPWLGNDLAANGARLMADRLFGAIAPRAAPLVEVALLGALAGLALGVWGLAAPEKALLASAAAAGLGLAVTGSVLVALSQAAPAPGLGQWLALVCGLGLAGQVAAGRLSELPRWHMGVPTRWLPYLFLAPGLALYLAWIVGPALFTVYLSLTAWDGLSPARWVGLDNFRRLLFADALFREALGNNLRWLVVFLTVPVALGLALALAFEAARRPLALARAGFYAPLALSFPVIGLVWAWLYNPRLGLINGLLAALGVQPAPGWLADPNLAIWCIIAAAAWRQVGYVLLLYLAGLRTLDPAVLDAAVVDGAGGWRLLRYVLLPLLGPVTSLVFILGMIDALRAFDLVQVMTRGGQGTQVLGTLMYLEGFTNYRMGDGAAIAVVVFALSSVGAGLYLRHALRSEANG